MIRALTLNDKTEEIIVEVTGDNYKGHGTVVFPKECNNGVSINLTRADALQLADTITHALK